MCCLRTCTDGSEDYLRHSVSITQVNFTIFGSDGFIGGAMARHLQHQGHSVWLPDRCAAETLDRDLGHVIYAIGLTGDFRTRAFDVAEAHVCKLTRLLSRAEFSSWLYLSSTRVYGGLRGDETGKEDSRLPVMPGLDGLYDISKLMGEALCLAQGDKNIRVVRLSNVYGHGQSKHTFLAAVIEELMSTGKAVIREAPQSAKDYIALAEVPQLLEAIALSGRERIYNVASGTSVTHAELGHKLTQLTGGSIHFEENAACRAFSKVDISRVAKEFGFQPRSLIDDLGGLLGAPR